LFLELRRETNFGETRGEERERDEGNILARARAAKKNATDGALFCELRTKIFSDRSAREAFFKRENPKSIHGIA
jgi:hypothetical protein